MVLSVVPPPPTDMDFAEEDLALDLMEEFDPRKERCAREPWRCPPMPKPEEVLAGAEQQQEEQSYRIWVASQSNRWLNGELFGHYRRDEAKFRRGEMVPARSNDLVNEHFDMVAFHAQMDLHVKSPADSINYVEEAEAKQDYSRLFLRELAREHAQQDGNADLNTDLANAAGRSGMLAAYIDVDSSNPRTGISVQVYDANLVYPVYEGKRGLGIVYVVYLATARDVISWHGDNAGTVERKVRKIARGGSGDGSYDALCEKECVVYYDRKNKMVLWGGELITKSEHNSGVVPFITEHSGIGMPGFMQTPESTRYPFGSVDELHSADMWQIDSRKLDHARKSQPLLWRNVDTHALKEAMASLAVYTYRTQVLGNRLVVRQGVMSAQEGEPEMGKGEEEITLLRADDELDQHPAAIDPGVFNFVTAHTMKNDATGQSVTVANPNPGGAQAGGSAIDMLRQQGAERWFPVTRMLQGFYTKLCIRALEIVRDNGEYLGNLDEPGITINRSRPSGILGLVDPHLLTGDMLQRAGCEVTVTLKKFNPASLPALIQALIMAKGQGLISQRQAVELIGAAQDIEDELRRIKDDQLDSVPEMLAAKALREKYNAAMRAVAEEDLETARQHLLEGRYLADQLTVAMASRISMVSTAVQEAMGWKMQNDMMGLPSGPEAAMQIDPASAALALPGGAGGGAPVQPNPAPFLSPVPFGGTTGHNGGRIAGT